MGATTTRYSFTKLVVNDLEKMASFYSAVCGLEQIERMQAEIGSDPIEEILLGVDGDFADGLVLLKFLEKPAPENGAALVALTNVTPGMAARRSRSCSTAAVTSLLDP